jgi:SM-20-related protein
MTPSDAVEAGIVAALESAGLSITDDFLRGEELVAWRRLAEAHRGDLKPAAVGRARLHATAIRSDRLLWLDFETGPPLVRALGQRFRHLQESINRRLLLGLWEFEAHVTLYQPGAFYAAHRDRLREDDARVLSCVLYLNEDWLPQHNGELRLYHGDDTSASTQDVLPLGGRLVLFLSEQLIHEVQPANRERWSVTGWFKRRALQNGSPGS